MAFPNLACEVDSAGIAHVFKPLVLGAVCACGRTVATLSDDERELVIRRRQPWPPPVRRSRPIHAAARGAHDAALERGRVVIESSRCLRVVVETARAARHTQRATRAAQRAARHALRDGRGPGRPPSAARATTA